MVGIVRMALKHPYTFVVMAVLIRIFGAVAALRTPTDIFPNINIPVISVVFSYNGLPMRRLGYEVVQERGRVTAAPFKTGAVWETGNLAVQIVNSLPPEVLASDRI